MPKVIICKETVVIPALSVGILVDGQTLEYPPQYFVHYHTVCLPLDILQLQRNMRVLEWNRHESYHYNSVHRRLMVDVRRQIGRCHIFKALFLVASNIQEMYSIGKADHGNHIIPQSEQSLILG
jgi:hypothetical protein